MSHPIDRRRILTAAAAALAVPARLAAAEREVEVQIAPVSPHTFRLTVFPIQDGKLTPVPDDGCLVQASWGPPIAKLRRDSRVQPVQAGGVAIRVTPDPLTIAIGQVQTLRVDTTTG